MERFVVRERALRANITVGKSRMCVAMDDGRVLYGVEIVKAR